MHVGSQEYKAKGQKLMANGQLLLMAKGSSYRGRLAPSPTGYLHLGHARTFWIAWQRARAAGGKLIFRHEDLDYQRCKPEFVRAMYEDLRWLGMDWDEGSDIGGRSEEHTSELQSHSFISYA